MNPYLLRKIFFYVDQETLLPICLLRNTMIPREYHADWDIFLKNLYEKRFEFTNKSLSVPGFANCLLEFSCKNGIQTLTGTALFFRAKGYTLCFYNCITNGHLDILNLLLSQKNRTYENYNLRPDDFTGSGMLIMLIQEYRSNIQKGTIFFDNYPAIKKILTEYRLI